MLHTVADDTVSAFLTNTFSRGVRECLVFTSMRHHAYMIWCCHSLAPSLGSTTVEATIHLACVRNRAFGDISRDAFLQARCHDVTSSTSGLHRVRFASFHTIVILHATTATATSNVAIPGELSTSTSACASATANRCVPHDFNMGVP